MEETVTLKQMLSEVIEMTLDDIKKTEAGSEERERAVKDAATLYKVYAEEVKAEEDREVDFKLKQQKVEMDMATKKDELESQGKNHFWEMILKGLELVVKVASIVVSILSLNKCLRYESNGTWTSNATRGVASNVTNSLRFG